MTYKILCVGFDESTEIKTTTDRNRAMEFAKASAYSMIRVIYN